MNPFTRLAAAVKRPSPTPEQIAAKAEAKRIADQTADDRISQETGAGQLYRSRGR